MSDRLHVNQRCEKLIHALKTAQTVGGKPDSPCDKLSAITDRLDRAVARAILEEIKQRP